MNLLKTVYLIQTQKLYNSFTTTDALPTIRYHKTVILCNNQLYFRSGL